MNFTPDNITSLAPNEIFVYGSNRSWRHGAGAAKMALKWGAIYGQGPFRGQTYGISTKDEQIRTLPLSEIKKEVDAFLGFAKSRPDLRFLVTKIGCGLANWAPEDIAPMFSNALDNVILPKEFWEIINKTVYR
jgi:hypothetical protein